jgi:hypothetical protein
MDGQRAQNDSRDRMQSTKSKIEQMVSLPLDCDNPGSRCKNRARNERDGYPGNQNRAGCPRLPAVT